ncbi:flagellar protein FlgN [Paenibacillus sp. IB182496]|uniref:Flagellar protein FlgN n=1 Tax=Paenibacillus sabuli TaxID=2772509 RepID=A0A927GS18_9BACL|nr:flagellar protein FlgN [Paenibacillus sabuli]MBD2845836.1 flagellar protein FlgN [Paenibacillus sabuli]
MSLAELIQTLDHQAAIYKQLLDIAEAKTAVLVRNNVEQLNQFLQKERKLVTEAESLEVRRAQLTSRHFATIGYRGTGYTISELIRSTHHSEPKQQLIEMQQALASMLEELKRRNELNQQLVRQSLAFVDYSVSLVVEDPSEDLIYKHPQKQLAMNGKNRMFDSRA